MNNNINVWVLHHYATPPKYTGLIRPFMFAQKLKDKNIIVNTISSSYLHYSDVNLINDKKKFIVDNDQDTTFVYLKTVNGNKGIKRIFNMLSYVHKAVRLRKKIAKEIGQPDIIIASSPHLPVFIAGMKLAKKFSVPLITEVRDLWPEVIFESGKLSKKSLLGKILLSFERKAYYNSESIIFLKEGDKNYLVEQGWNIGKKAIPLIKTYYINNGVDIKNFDRMAETYTVNDNELNNDKFKVIYTGALRPVNDIDFILDSAKLLMEDNVLFYIYGNGSELPRLQNRIIEEQISNVKFQGYIDKKFLPNILKKANVNLLNYSNALYNWSRGNSSNKLFDYLASGKPVISTVKMGYSTIDKYKCGVEIDSHKPEVLAEVIRQIKKMSKEDYNTMSLNARKASKEFDYEVLANKMAIVINDTLKKHKDKREKTC